MVNKSKAKGTLGETAVVRWLQTHGFPHADRQPPRGNRDCGDIAVTAGVVAEVKVRANSAGMGQPSLVQLSSWMAQTETERVNAGAALAVLVVKRTGTTDVGRWFAYLPMRSLAWLMDAPGKPADPNAPVCLPMASLAVLMRAAGFGQELEDVAEVVSRREVPA